MTNSAPVTSLGRLGEVVRNILGRLSPLEAASGRHDDEISKLKERAEAVQAELDRLRKVSNHQGLMLEDHERKIAELSDNVGDLQSEVDKRETQIRALHTVVRGEQVKRGRANARANRAEEALSRKRK
jgi:chromosome segregation ATPase